MSRASHGLWDRHRDAAGQWQHSYTMLPPLTRTMPPLFRDSHQPNKGKRMVVILPKGSYDDWLTAISEQSRDFLVPFPSDRLVASPMG